MNRKANTCDTNRASTCLKSKLNNTYKNKLLLAFDEINNNIQPVGQGHRSPNFDQYANLSPITPITL